MPHLQPVEILGGDLTIGDTIEEMLADTRWKIGPPNLGVRLLLHAVQPPDPTVRSGWRAEVANRRRFM
jgi:hypothetical protein